MPPRQNESVVPGASRRAQVRRVLPPAHGAAQRRADGLSVYSADAGRRAVPRDAAADGGPFRLVRTRRGAEVSRRRPHPRTIHVPATASPRTPPRKVPAGTRPVADGEPGGVGRAVGGARRRAGLVPAGAVPDKRRHRTLAARRCRGRVAATPRPWRGDMPSRQVAATPRPRRGYSVETSAATPRPRRGYSVETSAATPRPRRGYSVDTSAATPRPRRGYSVDTSAAMPRPRRGYSVDTSAATPRPRRGRSDRRAAAGLQGQVLPALVHRRRRLRLRRPGVGLGCLRLYVRTRRSGRLSRRRRGRLLSRRRPLSRQVPERLVL